MVLGRGILLPVFYELLHMLLHGIVNSALLECTGMGTYKLRLKHTQRFCCPITCDDIWHLPRRFRWRKDLGL